MTPKQLADILRELGISDAERRRYRDAVREYRKLYPEIKATNRRYGVNHELAPIPDDKLIPVITNELPLDELTELYKQQSKLFKQTGKTASYLGDIDFWCSILNEYSGTETYKPEMFYPLSPRELQIIAQDIEIILRYFKEAVRAKRGGKPYEEHEKAFIEIKTILGLSH